MLSGFLFQLRTVRRFDRYAGVCGLYMVGDIVGMGAARGALPDQKIDPVTLFLRFDV